jgi:flagellin-like hook-associated protein FlgL
MSKNKRKKGPQMLTVALLAAYPVLCGHAATSFALSHQQLSGVQKTPQQSPLQHRAKNFQGLDLQSAYQSPAFFSQTEEEYQTELRIATQKLSSAEATLASATQKLNLATTKKASAQAALDKAQSALNSTQANLDAALSKVEAAQADLDEAQAALDASDANLTQQEETLATAQAALEAAQTNLTTATSNLAQAQATLTSNQQTYQTAQTAQANAQQAYQTAQSTTSAKLTILQTAQANYNSSQVPNPNYVAPSYTTQPTSYQIPDNNFMTGEPWIGDGSGQNGAPEIHPGHLHFSYIGTEVYQDILISPRAMANYTFTVGIWNQDQNSVGYTGNIADTYSLRIYFYDADNNLIHQNSITSSEAHSWRDVTLQGNTNTTTPVSKVRIGVYGIDNGFWQGTYGPAMQNVRLTLGWITGSTQGSTTTGTMQVSINEGGESTFVAPNGGIFVSSNLRYEAIDDPSCGTNITPSNLGGNVIQLVADNSIWGDPCGGSYKRIVGTLTYSSAEPQFIKDATLLPAIAAAQLEYDNALTAEQQALTSYQQSQDQTATASTSTLTSQQTLEEAQDEVTSAQSEKDAAQSEFEAAQSQKDEAAGENNTLKASVDSATAALAAATSDQEGLTTELSDLESDISAAESNLEDAETNVEEAQDDVTSAQEDVDDAQAELDAIPAYVAPEPEPEEEEKIELPPLEDLTKVNFEEIVATDLTEAQAEELKEAALETFETAEKGSEEYNSALEALMVAAQQNDITVDPSLAEIPGVGAAVVALADAINFLGNAGADMSPQVREESEKVVVTAVVAGNAAIAAAAGAASSAASAVASSASSGPSSRKIN